MTNCRLSIRQMLVFQAVMMTRSTTEAAKQLNTTQPAISKMVSNTENLIGFKLFKRISRRLVPTPEALHLIPLIARLLGELETVQLHLDDLRGGYAGHLSIVGIQTLNASIATEAITRILEKHSRIQIQLINLSAHQVLERMVEHRADIGLIYAPIPAGDFETVRLGEWNAVCVFGNDHPLASKEVIGPADLTDYPLISYIGQTQTGGAIRQVLAEAGEQNSIAMVCNSTPSVLFLVAKGAGVGIVDIFSCFAENFPNITSRPFVPAVSNVPTALVSSHASASSVTKLFLQHLISAARIMTPEAVPENRTGR